MLEERKQEILNPTQPQERRNLNQDISQNEDIPERKVSQRSEPDKDKVQDTVSQRSKGAEYQEQHQTQYETKIQSAQTTQTEIVAKPEPKTELPSVPRPQDREELQTPELTWSQIKKPETELRSQNVEGGAQNNNSQLRFSPAHGGGGGGQNNSFSPARGGGGQNDGAHFSPAASSWSRNNVNALSSPSTATSGLRHVRNEEQRAYNRSELKRAEKQKYFNIILICRLTMILNRSLHKEERTELKVDMGRQKDAWMELYGNSVLNNTLQVLRDIEYHIICICAKYCFFSISGENRAAPVEEKPVSCVEPRLLQGWSV